MSALRHGHDLLKLEGAHSDAHVAILIYVDPPEHLSLWGSLLRMLHELGGHVVDRNI
jgi:hypothetical protein